MNSFLILSTLDLSLGGLVFLLGFIILRENPAHRLNRTVALMLFFGGIGAVLGALSIMASRTPTTAAGATAPNLLESVSYLWEFFFPTLFLFASIFPEERAFTRRMPAAGRWWTPGFGTLVFAPHVFHFVLMMVVLVWKPELTLPRVGVLRYVASVAGVAGVFLRLFLLVHQALFSLVNLGFGLAAIALLFDSWRRATVPRLKGQLGVIGVGLGASLVCYSLATSIPQLLNLQIGTGLRSGLTIAALTLGPGSIAYAIVRHKFLDARLLARRGILYALASASLVGLYLAVLQPLNRSLSAAPGVDARVFGPVFLVMALALFQPAIARLEELLDRMLLKDPADYRNVLRQLGRELQTTIDLEQLLGRTARTLSNALLLKTVHVVALTPERPIAHTGSGAPLPDDVLGRVAELLPRVAAREASFRLDERAGLLPADRALLEGTLGIVLLVPLRWHDDLLGALLLGGKLTETNFTSEDVSLLTTLAGQVAVSLQNALLLRDRVAVARFEQELNLARQIQRDSLLSEFPAIPGCDVHALYIPSREVGGDFYDVVPTGDGSYLIAIADVSGKGMPAALLSSMLQASLRTQSSNSLSLCAILKNINSLLYRSTAVHQFATFFLARVEGESLRLTFSNAGHNWPVVMRPSGERTLLERGGTVLGILESLEFEEAQVALGPGDLVVLYTDGVSEAMNAHGEQFGEQRLYDAVEAAPRGLPARGVAELLHGTLREFLGELEPQDDLTVLVLRVTEPVPAGRAVELVPEEVAAR
ncbi:MAG TPA: PP2C family protein-serine/threonine phosphatase [Candidatus Eisenbacteria bacterium]|jgi:sigma-B regulation protein RsbU (phosphoserine phosphatase)